MHPTDLTDFQTGLTQKKPTPSQQTKFIPKTITTLKRVLIIDDDRDLSDLLKLALREQRGVMVTVAHDPFEAMSLMLGQVYDLVLLDWNLPQLNGQKTIIEMEKIFRFDPVVPMEWHQKKADVITFSSDSAKECKFLNTKHFRQVGHISKGATLYSIVRQLYFFLDLTPGIAA